MADLRVAGMADLPALRALVEKAYRGESAKRGWTHEADLLAGDRTSDEELAASLADPATSILLYEADGGLQGTVTVVDRGGGLTYLGMLCVDPDLQAGGLGKALIAGAEDFARERFGARLMELTVVEPRQDLIAWYLRRGYADTGERRPFPYPAIADYPMVVLSRVLG